MTEQERYTKSLCHALTAYMEGDNSLLKKHKNQYGIAIHSNPLVERMSILKAVTGMTSIPMLLRSKAKTELSSAGYESLDDGDVP